MKSNDLKMKISTTDNVSEFLAGIISLSLLVQTFETVIDTKTIYNHI